MENWISNWDNSATNGDHLSSIRPDDSLEWPRTLTYFPASIRKVAWLSYPIRCTRGIWKEDLCKYIRIF